MIALRHLPTLLNVDVDVEDDDLLFCNYFQTRTFIHLFNDCTQNWFAVASILEHTLATLKGTEAPPCRSISEVG